LATARQQEAFINMMIISARSQFMSIVLVAIAIISKFKLGILCLV